MEIVWKEWKYYHEKKSRIKKNNSKTFSISPFCIHSISFDGIFRFIIFLFIFWMNFESNLECFCATHRYICKFNPKNSCKLSDGAFRATSGNSHTAVAWWICSGTCGWWTVSVYIWNCFDLPRAVTGEEGLMDIFGEKMHAESS